MIDFELLKYADIEVVSRKLTPEDKKEISEAIKAHRAKEAQREKARPVSAARKTVKAGAR